MKKIILLALMVSICISQTPQYFFGNVQCACQQFLSQVECNSNPLCSWTQVTPTQVVTISVGYCGYQQCSTASAQICATLPYCYYQASTTADAQVCFKFNGCESIILATGQTCQSVNTRCVPNTNTATKNQCATTLQSCSTLNSQTCGQGTTITDEGYCYWTGSQCKVIEQCNEITNSAICSSSKLAHACYWNTQNNTCIPQSCSNLIVNQTSNQCTFVYQSPLFQSNVQPCNYNATTSQCNPVAYGTLTVSNCATNTGFYHRWVGNQTQGQCIQCNAGRHIFRNQCECKQILQPTECGSYPNCFWQVAVDSKPAQCINNPCTNITSQTICSQVSTCYWNSSATTPSCVGFTKCSDIKGKTQLDCYAQSTLCPGSDGTSCQTQVQLKTCEQYATYTNATSGNSTILPSVCYNSIGKDGYCTYTPQNPGSTMGTCSVITLCSTLTTRQLCDQFYNSCYWQASSNSCTQKTCSYFITQKTCTYVQPIINENTINICYWNPNTNLCMSFDNSLDFDQNSCYNNTARTHHWSQPTNAQKGLCLPCQMGSVLNIKSQCSCKELTNYTDCALASPQCIWQANTQTCVIQTCTNLTTQAQCILSSACYWKVGKNGAVGTCAAIGSQSLSCSSLNGTTQQECLAQSQSCPGTSGGKCSSSNNSCSSFKSFYTCFGSVGTDGVCQWDEITASCSGISSCSMITTATQCNLVKNACYWNSTACLNQNCATLSQCTYYLTSPNQNYDVKQCMTSASGCVESSSGLKNLTSSTCYLNSGRQAKWINGTDGFYCSACYSQLLTVLLLIISILI